MARTPTARLPRLFRDFRDFVLGSPGKNPIAGDIIMFGII